MADYNGLPPIDLPLPDKPEVITSNVFRLNESIPNPRTKLLMDKLVGHLHQFVQETNLTTEEWEVTIDFLTRVGQKCTPLRQEFILLSDVLGVSALVDALNNLPDGKATESTVLGPFHTHDSPDVEFGGSIASEGKGEHMIVEGRVLSSDGVPIPNAVIDTWETDGHGLYDTQYAERTAPDCRGKLRSDSQGNYSYRAVVPVPYPIPNDGPVGELLGTWNRHNMRPAHLHLMVEAPGYKKLVTSVYPEGDKWLMSDVVFGTKESLVVSLENVTDTKQVQARKVPGDSFKLLRFDIFMRPDN